MGKLWPLMADTDADVLTFDQTAKLFGYSPARLREMIAEGRFPGPRGEGHGLYYAGEDVAAIRLLLGRWRPSPEPPGKTPKNADKSAKTTRNDEDTE